MRTPSVNGVSRYFCEQHVGFVTGWGYLKQFWNRTNNNNNNIIYDDAKYDRFKVRCGTSGSRSDECRSYFFRFRAYPGTYWFYYMV